MKCIVIGANEREMIGRAGKKELVSHDHLGQIYNRY